MTHSEPKTNEQLEDAFGEAGRVTPHAPVDVTSALADAERWARDTEAALDATPDSIGVLRSVLDDGGRFIDAEITFANEAGRRRWFDSRPLGELRGQRLFERWPGLRPLVFDLYASASERGAPVTSLREVATPDGTRTCASTITPTDGGLLDVTRDVTEDRHAAVELHASEERLRRIMEGLDAIVGFQDEPDGPVILSGQVERILGYRPEDVRTYAAWQALVHPDDLPACEAAWACPEGSWELEYRMRRADGRWTWVADRGRQNRPGETGRPVCVGVIVDVTAQRAAAEAVGVSEARLRRTIEGIDAIVCYQDPGRGPAILSPQVERILGWRPDEVAEFSAWEAIVHPEDLARCREVWAPTDAAWDIEYRVRRKDGTWAWVADRGRRKGPDDDRSLGMFGILTDVTERRAAADALRRSREALAEAQRVARVGDWSWRLASGEVTWSDELSRIYGITSDSPPTSFDGQERFIVDPADLARVRQAVGDLVGSGRPYVIEYGVRRDDGVTRHVVGRGEAVRDGLGEIVLVRGTVTDETELHQARLALREAQERLAAVVASVRESISILQPVRDADGAVIDHVIDWVNDAWRDRFACGLPDPVGRRIFEVHPELSWHLPLHREVLATGESRRTDTELANGRWIETDFSVFGGRLLAVARDITARKTAEQDLAEGRAALAEAQRIAHVGSWTFDPAVSSWTWSEEVHRMVGLVPGEVAPSMEVAARFMDPATVESFVRALEGAARGDPFEMEIDIHRVDGGRRRIQVAGERVTMAHGHAVVQGSCADITELRGTQARLDQAQRTEMVGRLAGGIAHDFNNLLAAIGGHAEFIESSLAASDPRLPDVIGIKDATQRAAALTRRLLAFGRGQAMRPEPLDLDEVTGALVPLLRSLCGEQVTVHVLPCRESCRVLADRTALEEAVVNLVLNAKDAMPGGGRILLRASVEALDETFPAVRGTAVPGRYARLTVADTGTGIAPEILPTIFDPFFTTKALGNGAGLGLASVEGAVVQMRGLITVETEPGRGSSFSILLPAIPDAEPADLTTSSTTGSPDGRGSILVVEDDPTLRALVRRMAERLGYEVVVADGAAPALAIAAERPGPFDAVVTDLLMPGMNGLEMSALLRETWPGLPVVFMSAYSPETVFADGMVPARSPFLAKPFTTDALAQALLATLERPAEG